MDFHCKENDGTTGAAHLIQTSFLVKNQTPVVRQTPYSPDIRIYRLGGLGVTFLPRDQRLSGSNPAEIGGFFST